MKVDLSSVTTGELIKELEARYPMGFVAGYVTDDPSLGNGVSEHFTTTGSPSIQRGLADSLVDYISAFAPLSSGPTYFEASFGETDEDDDDDWDDEYDEYDDDEEDWR